MSVTRRRSALDRPSSPRSALVTHTCQRVATASRASRPPGGACGAPGPRVRPLTRTLVCRQADACRRVAKPPSNEGGLTRVIPYELDPRVAWANQESGVQSDRPQRPPDTSPFDVSSPEHAEENTSSRAPGSRLELSLHRRRERQPPRRASARQAIHAMRSASSGGQNRPTC
jgi:hypothetical protein